VTATIGVFCVFSRSLNWRVASIPLIPDKYIIYDKRYFINNFTKYSSIAIQTTEARYARWIPDIKCA